MGLGVGVGEHGISWTVDGPLSSENQLSEACILGCGVGVQASQENKQHSHRLLPTEPWSALARRVRVRAHVCTEVPHVSVVRGAGRRAVLTWAARPGCGKGRTAEGAPAGRRPEDGLGSRGAAGGDVVPSTRTAESSAAACLCLHTSVAPWPPCLGIHPSPGGSLPVFAP